MHKKKTIRVQLLLLQLQKEIFQTLEDGLKDHCNWLLSHCSAKVCDFFLIRQTQRGERRRKTILDVSDHFLDYTSNLTQAAFFILSSLYLIFL